MNSFILRAVLELNGLALLASSSHRTLIPDVLGISQCWQRCSTHPRLRLYPRMLRGTYASCRHGPHVMQNRWKPTGLRLRCLVRMCPPVKSPRRQLAVCELAFSFTASDVNSASMHMPYRTVKPRAAPFQSHGAILVWSTGGVHRRNRLSYHSRQPYIRRNIETIMDTFSVKFRLRLY